jgi:hypothetical protein
MTPVERQERLTKLMDSFNKTVFKVEGAKPGDTVPFEFVYSGTEDVAYYTLGCGCTSAEVVQHGNGMNDVTIKGVVKVDNIETIRHITQGSTWTKTASITVYFDDGIDAFQYENFERRFNTDKLTVSLNIQIEVQL